MIKRAGHLGSVIGLTASLCAHAQSAQPNSAANDTSAQGIGLEEIVITAERRPEVLQQTPIAVSVISGKDLAERGVKTIDDLGNVSPSLNIQNQQSLSYVNIRGVGLQATNPTTSSGVAIYSDGFFVPHETAIADDYFDVGQIEVLRGPQGTLVGQSSTGGAIFVTSVRPNFDHTTGYAQQSIGNYGYRQTEAAVNVPISDHLAFRVAGTFDEQDSFYRDLNVGGAAITSGLQPGNVDSRSARIGVAWQPTAGLDVYIKYDTTVRNGDGFVGKDYGELAGANNSVDPRLSNPFDVSYDQPSWNKYRMSRVTSEINWTIDEAVALRSLTGYQHDYQANLWDNDFTYQPLSWASQRFDETAIEQELDLISQTPGPFSWIVGAFYLRDSTPTYLNLTNVPVVALINTGPYEHSYALFAQGTYKFADKWQLLLGGRENRDQKVSTGSQQATVAGFPLPPSSLAATVSTTTPTGKVALSYFPDPDSSVYVSASRGFKAGGANPGNSVNFLFQPEKIDAYEGGYKAALLERSVTLSSSVFYYDYRNMQTTVFDPIAQRAIINVPRAKIYGAELEGTWQVDGLVLTGSGAYNHSRVNQQLELVDAGNPFAGPQDVTSRQLPYAPTWTGSAGANYTLESPIGDWTLGAQYSYTTRAYASLFQVAPRDLLNSHSLVNANLALKLKDGIRLEAYGTNLANALYAAGTIGNDAAIWGPPRQFGMRVRYDY
jgi:iron complex outermembrane receptor protein